MSKEIKEGRLVLVVVGIGIWLYDFDIVFGIVIILEILDFRD